MDKTQALPQGADNCAVRIAVRQRPLSDSEKILLLATNNEENAEDFIQRAGDMAHNIIVVGDRPFVFDAILDDKVNQEELFVRLVEPMVDKLLSGFYCTVLAYGQTGTGKSYTMGLHSEVSFGDSSGIVPRVLTSLFNRSSHTDETTTQIFVSFVEIYNERVFDLLSDQSSDPVNTKGHKFIGGNKRRVYTLDEAQLVLDNGNRNRHVRPTKMNAQSSRSHAIFTLHAIVRQGNRRTEAAMHLVDLAGSEGVRRTGHHGAALTEGVHINQGLLSIGKVLQALSVGNKVIPYRDSVLSSVLQDSLNVNSYLTLLACISPLRDDASETLSTLRFAQSAKSLRNTPQVNAIISDIKKNRTPSKVKTPKKHLSSIPAISSPLRPRNKLTTPGQSSVPPLATSTTFKRRPTVPLFRSKTVCTPSKVHVNPQSVSTTKDRLNRTATTSAIKSIQKRRPVQSMAFGDRPSRFVHNQSQMFLNVSTSTTVGDQSNIESSTYSPIIRRCIQEMSHNLGDQIRDIVLSMQANGTLSHRTTMLDMAEPMETDSHVADDKPDKSEVTDDSDDGHWSNGDATAIHQHTTRSSFHELFSEPTTSLVHELPVSENIVKTIGDDLKQTTIDEMMANPEDSDEATTTLVEFTDPHNNLDYSFQIPALPPLPASHAQTVRRSTRRRMTVDERPRTVPTRQSARISMRRQTITEPIPVVVASTPATKTRGKPKEHSSNTDNILAKLTEAKSKKQAKSVQHSFILNLFNAGTMKELQILPQVGPKMAYLIITHRTTHGKLKSIQDIAKMPIWRGKGWNRFATLNCLE